jgi:SAM-dependent methyltransferase
MPNKVKDALRFTARSIAFRIPFLRNRRVNGQVQTREYWDNALTTWAKPYLGGTLQVDSRDMLTLGLIRHATPTPEPHSILDIGCASGSLFNNGQGGNRLSRYVGLDISQVAVDQAKAAYANDPRASFFAGDLCAFQPQGTFDAIVFNEVLYYLDLPTADQQVRRYCQFLSPGGILIASLKNDPKSHAVLRDIARHRHPLQAVLFQLQLEPRFKVVVSRERPAFLVSAFK